MPLVVDLLIALAAAGLAIAVSSNGRWKRHAAGAVSLHVADIGGRPLRRHRRLRRLVGSRLDPATSAGLMMLAALALAIGGGTVVAILALLTRTVGAVQRLDDAAASWGHAQATGWSTDGLHAVTSLGETTTAVGVAIVVALIDVGRSRRLAAVPILAAVIAGQGLLVVSVKDLADRVRPAIDPVAATLGPSFPSGHSATAAAAYAGVALVLSRYLPLRARIGAAATAVGTAAAVAASRVLLDLHWASDVLGGLALGWAWFAICAIAFGGRLLRPDAAARAATHPAAGDAAKPS